MSQSNISIRIDEKLKQQFDSLCNELGLTMSTTLNMFIKTVVREKGIPFQISIKEYNEETKQAIEDAHKGIGLSKAYDSVNEMMKDILEEN